MTQPIQHVTPNISSTAISAVDSGVSDHADNPGQYIEFSGYLSGSYPLADILQLLRERLVEDDYHAVESWLIGGEPLPLQEEFAGEIVPFLVGNIELFPPQIRERIQQLAVRLHNEGEPPASQMSWPELKGQFQQQASRPDTSTSTSTSNETITEGEFLDTARVQIDAQKPILTPTAAALGRGMVEEAPMGMSNTLSTMGSTGVDAVRSLSVGGLATASQPSAGLLNVPLGEPGWNQALGRQIQWMIGSEIQSASLKITPPQLGPIEINLAVKNDQANILFAAQHVQVREALEAAIPRLREMFGEISLDLVNVDVEKKEDGKHAFSAYSSGQSEEEDQNEGGYSDTQTQVNDEAVADGHGDLSIRSNGLVDDYA